MDLFNRFSRSSNNGPPPVAPRPHRDRPSPGSPPWNTHNRHASVQDAQGIPPSAHWSPPSGATQSTSQSRLGNPPRSDSHSRRDDVVFPGGFRPPGNQGNFPAPNQPIAHTNSFSRAAPDPQTEVRDWFVAIDQDGNGELSYEELHHALFNGNVRFAPTTVKYLVSLFDQNGDGVIGFDEFKPLWNYLNNWRRMFDSFDVNRDGRIDTNELGRALAHYDIRVSPNILEMVVRKYARARNWQAGYGMDLDHFVCVCVVVRQMCTLYDQCSAGGQPQTSREDFLRAVISLP